jgi:protein-tyrosine phosphatase
MSPDEVTWITENVAITNFFSAHSQDVVSEHKVQAILCLDRDLSGGQPAERGLECVRVVPLDDGPNEVVVFREAVSALQELVARFNRVIVHCRAGRSRSIAVVAAYLMKVRQLEADEALEFVRAKRESAVAPELERLVERFSG